MAKSVLVVRDITISELEIPLWEKREVLNRNRKGNISDCDKAIRAGRN